MHRQQSCENNTTDTTTINDWQHWCRLCAKRDGQYLDAWNGQTAHQINANINIATAVKDYFHIHIEQNANELPLLVCTECCNTINSLESYVQHIKKVQKMYEDLQNAQEFYTEMQLKDLYQKFGIVKCELFVPHALPGTDVATTTTPAIEQIFVDTDPVPKPINVKDEEMDETELNKQKTESKSKIKIELPDPFGNGAQTIQEFLRTSAEDSEDDDGDRDATNQNCTSSAEDENETKAMDNQDSDDNTLASAADSKHPNHKCHICRKSFVQNRNYFCHMRRKHKIDVPLYTCEQCTTVSCAFRRKKDLDRHIKKEHEPTIYPCPHCDRIFKGKKVADNHIRIEHEGEGTFICEECGESVRTKERLTEHMAIHTGGAFECKECGKRFARKNYLKKHLEIHGDKHVCGECGAKLTTSKALKYHMKVHSDEMPYKCNYCGRRFKRTKNLKNHLITHTGLKPYSCDFCDKTFSTGSSCRYHKKHLHPKELAAMEASGVKTFTKNIPKMHVLKAITQVVGDVVKPDDCVSDKRIKLPKLDSELPDA